MTSLAAPVSALGNTPVYEHPEFFESGERPLYGLYYAPRGGRLRDAVVVHCHGLGIEQLTDFRNEVGLARAAAALGIPTFRFHARGHGDSAGDFETLTLDRWVDDALCAAERAQALSGASRVIWLGVRFGALIAARASRHRTDTAGLALWEPMNRTPDYLRAMLRTLLMSQLAAGKRPDATVEQLLARLESEGRVDVHGYFLHRAIVHSTGDGDLIAALAGHTAPVQLVQIQSRRSLSPAHEALAQSLEAGGARVAIEKVAEEPGWHFVSNPAWRSAELVRLTTEWLDALA